LDVLWTTGDDGTKLTLTRRAIDWYFFANAVKCLFWAVVAVTAYYYTILVEPRAGETSLLDSMAVRA